MTLSSLAPILLAAIAAGGVAYVFLHPLLSGSARGAKRQKALVGGTERAIRGAAAGTVNRREQVAQSLKEVEDREKARDKVTIEIRVAQAGLDWSKRKFIAVSAGLGLGIGLMLLALTGAPLLAAGGLVVGALGLPRWVLGFLKKRRLDKYLTELPNAMDVIVRGIRSGLPIGDCLRIVASEAQEPVRSEFRFLVDQQALGLSLSEAVVKLYPRVPVPETNFFAIVIGIQSKAGGNLSEALNNLSRVLRDRKKMKSKVQALSMEAKSSAAIIGSLPFIVGSLTYLTSPDYIELLWTTGIGKMMLIVSAFWMAVGIAVMRKMINFQI